MDILIAEDDRVTALKLQRALEKLGCSVAIAKDGAEAWNIVNSRHVNILVSDWMMPKIDGPELCRRIRAYQNDSYTYVILLTARPIRVRRQTMDWLGRHPVRWDLLVMRDEDDWTSSHTFKRTELRDLQRRGFEIRLAVDDDPRNVEMYRRAEVPALYFHSGYYD